MTDSQWSSFVEFRESYKKLCEQWSTLSEKLYPLQKTAAAELPAYPLENAVVYNTAYDTVTKDDKITLIVIGDNPGKEEQLNANRQYLVGQSGRIAEGFFRRNSELGIDFRKNVLILNKTPVHTAKTVHLKYLIKNGDSDVQSVIQESQIQMARLAFQLHAGLAESVPFNASVPQLWLVGYSELKRNGIFSGYRDELKRLYKGCRLWDSVFVYQHFSMNRFLVELHSFQSQNENMPLKECLEKIGSRHRKEIFENS